MLSKQALSFVVLSVLVGCSAGDTQGLDRPEMVDYDSALSEVHRLAGATPDLIVEVESRGSTLYVHAHEVYPRFKLATKCELWDVFEEQWRASTRDPDAAVVIVSHDGVTKYPDPRR
jgi:hypothetical protein